MTEEKIKALQKDIMKAVDNGDICLLCENHPKEWMPECEKYDYDCEKCGALGECKCGNCLIGGKKFELRKDYDLADEAPSAEDEAGGWIKPEEG